MSISMVEAMALIQRALELHDAARPVPSQWTTAQVAEALDCSDETVRRMKLTRNSRGMFPYSEVVRALTARKAKSR